MVRVSPSICMEPSRSPHARGDGPPRALLGFSPRPWGWSGKWLSAARSCAVLPTPVGMVRRCGESAATCSCSPHARGDGPSQPIAGLSVKLFSPRPWGWSARSRALIFFPTVLPTPVGMVRTENLFVIPLFCSPHARGDGPPVCIVRTSTNQFSPRPWGWSGPVRFPTWILHVLPTPVGMVRAVKFWGDVLRPVLPTPVGMVRVESLTLPAVFSSPHARGDGPSMTSALRVASVFSPRPWGWSDTLPLVVFTVAVLPTPVGMVRCNSDDSQQRGSSPHARGDGPALFR